MFGIEVLVNTNSPEVHLPRPRRAGFPAVLAVFLGVTVGLVLGHAFLGGVAGLVLWSWKRASTEGLESEE